MFWHGISHAGCSTVRGDLTRPEVPALADRIWKLRQQYTGYDARYLVLAEALQVSLYTCDGKLAGGGHDAQVGVLPRTHTDAADGVIALLRMCVTGRRRDSSFAWHRRRSTGPTGYDSSNACRSGEPSRHIPAAHPRWPGGDSLRAN